MAPPVRRKTASSRKLNPEKSYELSKGTRKRRQAAAQGFEAFDPKLCESVWEPTDGEDACLAYFLSPSDFPHFPIMFMNMVSQFTARALEAWLCESVFGSHGQHVHYSTAKIYTYTPIV